MRRIVAFIIVLSMVLTLCACGHQHTWVDATCTAPKTCSSCGATEGEPLGHNWKTPTCTDPKKCTNCGATEGEPLGHNWKDPTCTEPRKCSTCGTTEGKPFGHVDGSWKTVNVPTLSETGKDILTCSVCGEEIDSRTTEKKAVNYSGGEFNFTRKEFIEYLGEKFGSALEISDNGEDFGNLGYSYSVYNSNTGDLYAIISLKENKKNNVTKVNIWGMESPTLMVSVFVLGTMAGLEVEETESIWDAAVEKLDSKKHTYTYRGLSMKYSNPEKDVMLFSIVGE